MTDHLVIGGDGLIGRALCEHLSKCGSDYASTTRREQSNQIKFTLGVDKPEKLPEAKVVYLVAAMNGFVAPETHGSETWVVNVDAQIALARHYKSSAFVVYVSSEAVENCGNTAYARQKAMVETYINSIDGAVFRPSKVHPNKAADLAAMMVLVGTSLRPGVYRWKS